MARYKHDDYAQTQLLPVHCDRQLLPGTFEYTLTYRSDEKLELAVFAARSKNAEGGAPAYAPAMLLTIRLFAYSKGIMHSRQIAQLCRANVVCLALSAETPPPCTTMAAFGSSLSAEITTSCRHILLGCDEAGLIGRERFASDGVQLPSPASQAWSGTKTALPQKAPKRPVAVEPAGSDALCQRCACRAGKPRESGRAAAENLARSHRENRGLSRDARGPARHVRHTQAKQHRGS
jgi:transposase